MRMLCFDYCFLFRLVEISGPYPKTPVGQGATWNPSAKAKVNS